MPSRRLVVAPIAVALMATLFAAHAAAQTTTTLAAPPVRPLDKTLFRPSDVDMVGTTDTQALLKMSGSRLDNSYYGVLDLATGCVGETYPTFARVEKLIRLSYASGFDPVPTTVEQRRAKATQALSDPATQAEIRQYLGLRARFGSRKDSESIYGGALDTNMSRQPYVTRDGRFAFYQRCGDAGVHNYSCHKAQEVGIVDLTSAARPRFVAVGRGTIAGLDPTGQKLVFIRDDEPLKVVVTHLDPATGTFTRAFAIPAPPLKPQTFYTIDPSRNGQYGAFFHWVNDSVANVTVVSMTDGHPLSRQQRQFVGTEVDDEGRLAWGTVNLVRAYGTTPKGVIKDAGPGDRIGWAPGGRLLVFDHKASTKGSELGDVACKLVKVTPIGS